MALQLGRKRQLTDSKIVSAKKLLVSGLPPKDVVKNLGVSLSTLQHWVQAFAVQQILISK